MTLVGVLVLLAGLIPFAAFSWGAKGHFRGTGAMPAGMKLISLLTLSGFAWFAWRLWRAPPAATWPLAVLLFGLAVAVFAAAVRATRRQRPTLAYETDQPVFLVQAGPYRHVRHPFYLSYLLYWLGTAAATAGGWGYLAPLVMLLVYGDAARREERKFANSTLATDYARYRAQAGMFLPRLRPGAAATPR